MIILIIIAAAIILAAIGSFLRLVREYRYRGMLIKNARDVINTFRKENADLKFRLEEAKKENAELRAELEELKKKG